ncbi:hypothetical protein Vadar_016709 [Vaccinium darrowii]|uniref:Uncharacterized protein n=1 Tax=Vaccinium darrowii TaxID=229202 RepID=A0ACB7ZJY8_9ERIC|nr:hypothetical protein Vadar_016709 [Vaccinium darrowii]
MPNWGLRNFLLKSLTAHSHKGEKASIAQLHKIPYDMDEVPILASTETTILAAISTLPAPQLSHLTHSISSLFHRHRRRLSSILASPTLFSLTLHHLHSLSLPQKSLLLARHLLSSFSLLTHSLHPTATPPPSTANLRHLDSALLLLLLCEIRQHNPQSLDTPLLNWRSNITDYICDTILTISTTPISTNEIVIHYIETIAKCRRFVGVMGCGGGSGGSGKEGREVAASVAAVAALPSVSGVSGKECAICKEEMKEGRDVCELPCEHLFHWICILPWLKKRNTCPCCRYRLPTDDVYGEIERLWEVVVKDLIACKESDGSNAGDGSTGNNNLVEVAIVVVWFLGWSNGGAGGGANDDKVLFVATALVQGDWWWWQ